MLYEQLKYHLPVFLLFFSATVFLWTKVRLSKISRASTVNSMHSIIRMKKAYSIFSILFLIVCVIVFLHSFLPDVYHKIVFPFVSWDIPEVNSFGAMILNVSLIWIIVTQMNLDIFLFRILSGNLEPHLVEKIIIYSQKSLLLGFLIMFVGMFVTITSLIALLLAGFGILVYYYCVIRNTNKYLPK